VKLEVMRWNFGMIFLFFFLGSLSLLSSYADPAPAKNGSLINPLRKYIKFKEVRSFRYKVEELIRQEEEKGLAKEVAVYFRCLSDGIWFGIGEQDKFAPASLMKVPLMVAYFKEAEKDPEILEKKIKYEALSTVSGLFVKPKTNFKPGEYYSVDELIKAMIIESDNNASLLLMKNIGTDVFAATYINLGILHTFLEEGDFISLKSLVGMFRVLYNASYLNEAMSEKALQYLANVSYKDGIAAGLPSDIIVAHKFGERLKSEENIKQLHDVGIVYYRDNPYLLGIMTRGADFQNLTKVIREISGLIYHEIDSQYKAEDKRVYPINEDEPN
jgi:beta-lactamase class A